MSVRALGWILALLIAAASVAQPRVDPALVNGAVITMDGATRLRKRSRSVTVQSSRSARPRKFVRSHAPTRASSTSPARP